MQIYLRLSDRSLGSARLTLPDKGAAARDKANAALVIARQICSKTARPLTNVPRNVLLASINATASIAPALKQKHVTQFSPSLGRLLPQGNVRDVDFLALIDVPSSIKNLVRPVGRVNDIGRARVVKENGRRVNRQSVRLTRLNRIRKGVQAKRIALLFAHQLHQVRLRQRQL